MANTASQDSLVQALADFHRILTPKELASLSGTTVPDESSVLKLISEIDKKRSSSPSQKVGLRFRRFLESVQQFTTVVDTLVSSNPQVAALVWGSVKLVIIAALNFFEYFERLSEMFEKFGDLCPLFSRFQALFPESSKLRESLETFYAIVITFCIEALRFLKSSTFKQLGKSLWEPFKVRFQDLETKLQSQQEKVDREIHFASELAKHRARQQTSMYQDEGRQHRLQISLYQDESRQHHSAQMVERSNNQDWRLQQNMREKEYKRILLLKKISDYDHRHTFSRARSRRHKDTGLWFFDCPEFRDWDQAEKSCGLWSHGIPGAGKTILAAGAIDYLFSHQKSTETSISYFFCEFANHQSLQTRTILGSLIKQILTVFGRITPEMENNLETIFYNPSREPDTEELYDVLVSVTRLATTTYLIIDGLDECGYEDRRQLLLYLEKLVVKSKSKVKLLISTRDTVDISRSPEMFYVIALEPMRTRPDIEIFISDIIDQHLEDGDLVISQPLMAGEIKQALTDGSGGMFLWVTFQVYEICRENNDNDIRRVLCSLPRGLNETYIRILKRIITERKLATARKIFEWLASARRPLSLWELSEAVAFEPGCLRWDQGNFPTCERKMLQNCANLVNHNKDDDTIQFVHSTVLESLTSPQLEIEIPDFFIRKLEANLHVGNICLTYLNFPDFETQLSRTQRDRGLVPPTSEWIDSMGYHTPMIGWLWKLNPMRFEMTKRSSPINTERFGSPEVTGGQSPQLLTVLARKFRLTEYVAENWLFHCSRISQDSHENWAFFKNLVFHQTLPFPHLPWERPEGITSNFYTRVFQWAVENDHGPLCKLVIGELETENIPRSTYIEMRYGTGQTPLQVASMRGNELVLQALIELGADVNTAPAARYGRTALQAAAGGGHLAVVDRLLQSKADVNAEPAREGGWTALQAAAGGGHLAIVDRLLQSKADVNAEPAREGGWTALQAAAGGGYLAVVDRLLQSNADVNAKPVWEGGRTALQAAAGGGHLAVVDRLLQSNADVNAKPAWEGGRTALQAAAGGGHLAVVDRLLQSNADVNAKPAEREGRTVLQAAAGGGHLAVVDRLLQSNADVNAKPAEREGRTALQAAAGGGHLAVVDRLLQSKADVNAEPAEREGRTALQAAAGGGHLAVVDRLLQSNADVNTVLGRYGRTAFQAAAGGGHLAVVDRLLQSNADVNAKPAWEGGWTALQVAAGGGHLAVVDRLLQSNADVNAEPAARYGRTALQAAAGGGHLAVVDRLLQSNADVKAKPTWEGGWTALQAAAEGGHLAVVDRLRKAGAME